MSLLRHVFYGVIDEERTRKCRQNGAMPDKRDAVEAALKARGMPPVTFRAAAVDAPPFRSR
jgi:hypothetical protein